jgi:hypothetical protein
MTTLIPPPPPPCSDLELKIEGLKRGYNERGKRNKEQEVIINHLRQRIRGLEASEKYLRDALQNFWIYKCPTHEQLQYWIRHRMIDLKLGPELNKLLKGRNDTTG